MRPSGRLRKFSRGFMLAEFTMTCAIGGMILSVLPAFYVASTKLWQREAGEIGAREQADLAIQRMKKELRNARNTSISANGTVLTLVLPEVSGTQSSPQSTAVFDSQGGLVDGDRVQYAFQSDSGSTGGSLYRSVTHVNGSTESPKPVANHLYPQLNPLAANGSGSRPVFAFDGANHTVTVTVTASEPKPSTTTFAPRRLDPVCARHGVALTRIATQSHPEGVVSCRECGTDTAATSEVATYQATLLLRNR